MSYRKYDAMLRSASLQNGWWRLTAGVVLALLTTAILTPFFMSLVGKFAPELKAFSIGAQGDLMIGTTHGGLFVILAGFALLLAATFIAAKLLHKRTAEDITGPKAKLRRDFVRVLIWTALATILMLFIPAGEIAQTSAPTRQYSLLVWTMWLPLGALGLMVQVTAEEVFFRGYLQTHLVSVTKSHWLGMGIAALLFGAGHYSMSADGIAAFFPVLWATAFGLVAGDLVARTGSLGAAIAVHFVNNALALFAVPVAGQLSGFGLWIREIDLTAAYTNPILIVIEALSLLILWLIARIALKR